MTGEEADELVSRITAQLHEHFEAVQILVSWNEEGESKAFNHGAGSWYARIGMAREFLIFDEAHIKARELGKIIKPSDDE